MLCFADINNEEDTLPWTTPVWYFDCHSRTFLRLCLLLHSVICLLVINTWNYYLSSLKDNIFRTSKTVAVNIKFKTVGCRGLSQKYLILIYKLNNIYFKHHGFEYILGGTNLSCKTTRIANFLNFKFIVALQFLQIVLYTKWTWTAGFII